MTYRNLRKTYLYPFYQHDVHLFGRISENAYWEEIEYVGHRLIIIT